MVVPGLRMKMMTREHVPQNTITQSSLMAECFTSEPRAVQDGVLLNMPFTLDQDGLEAF